jgi:peptidoglycan/LPS O-acetylase OafA/YrhL
MAAPFKSPMPSSGRLGYLESIRGIAALGVVFAHLYLTFYHYQPSNGDHAAPRWLEAIVRSPAGVFINGVFAVRTFYVLSGVVLSLAFFQQKDRSLMTVAALHRYPRLLIPVLGFILIAWAVLRLGGYRNVEAAAVMAQEDGSWLTRWYRVDVSLPGAIRQGVYETFFDWYWNRTLNNPLWTMRTELAGSYLLFAFLALFGHLRWRWALYLTALVVIDQVSDKPYYVDFLAGILLSDLFVANRSRTSFSPWLSLPILGLVLLLGSLTPEDPGAPILGRVRLGWYLPTLGASLIVGTALFSRHLQCGLAWRPFILVGKLSFPLYCVHMILDCSLVCWLYLILRAASWTHDASAALSSAAGIAVSLLCAWGLYYLLEVPAIAFSRRLERLLNG